MQYRIMGNSCKRKHQQFKNSKFIKLISKKIFMNDKSFISFYAKTKNIW